MHRSLSNAANEVPEVIADYARMVAEEEFRNGLTLLQQSRSLLHGVVDMCWAQILGPDPVRSSSRTRRCMSSHADDNRFFACEFLIFECTYPSWEGTHFQSGLKIGRSEAADFQPGASRIENDKRFSTRSFVHFKSAAFDRPIFNPDWKWYFVLCFRDTANSLESVRKNHYNQRKWKIIYTFFSFRAYTSQWHTPLSEPKLGGPPCAIGHVQESRAYPGSVQGDKSLLQRHVLICWFSTRLSNNMLPFVQSRLMTGNLVSYWRTDEKS